MNKYYESALTVVILCLIAAGTYTLLSPGEDTIPGWSNPILIKKKWYEPPLFTRSVGDEPSLLIHNGEFWVAYEYANDIAIFHSKNGKKWSSCPSPETPSGYDLMMCPQWLKRPDGTVWLVFFPTTFNKKPSVFHYSQLKEDKIFTEPEKANFLNLICSSYYFSLDENYFFPSDAPTILKIRYPSGTWMGIDVTGDRTNCTIHDPEGVLPDQFLLENIAFSTLFIDDEETLWAVSRGSVITSHDGNTWSDPLPIPVGRDRQVFQRSNGEYVSLYAKDDAIFMITSPDGIEWGGPSPVVTNMKQPGHLDAAECNGILWTVFKSDEGIYITWYIEEQYYIDEIGACLFTLFLGIGWVFFRKSSYYPSFEAYMEKIRQKEEINNKLRVITVLSIFGYLLAFGLTSPCMKWVAAALFSTVAFSTYLWVEREMRFFTHVVLSIFTIFHWIVAVVACMGS